ncbi:hypothetical protein GCK32_005076 [Trichostrongylus colubriformis]|uniref:Uncharacterized protein n=1 Tax=Trichostrongylus colubriformis TaxID=6319 RepID=A0AAN8FW72_TRICO
MALSSVMDSSSMNNDVRYGELISFFDNAQEYFTMANEEPFDRLLSRFARVPGKFEKTKIRSEQLKQRYIAKHGSFVQRLEQVSSLKKQLKSHCEDSQRNEASLQEEIADYRARHQDPAQRYLQISKDLARMEIARSVALKDMADASIKRLVTKLSAKEANLITSTVPDRGSQMQGSDDGEVME